jgi:hypothetical protein
MIKQLNDKSTKQNAKSRNRKREEAEGKKEQERTK